ncbi:DUF4157 domain-containing protein [Mucilaginibacter sp. X5P1]|uniref:eCIS core domain-containing protein n=1 Tax=Mucilaginibacter sp. X5P1 TaxID=2723088 RepID=UPI0017FA3379|nr:DUF4157 domain-containing protein [Mucilaginibacter sp. X5P1]MBB6140114.1 hypothetical protein [Mucilaginibacter sp. X5P1]
MKESKQSSQQENNPLKSSSLFFKDHTVQAKLTINQPNDAHEQQADHMADQVMRMPDPSVKQPGFFKPAINPLQRKCHECEEDDKKLHRKESSTGEVHADSQLNSYVSSLGSTGQSMSSTARQFFEPRFGYNFSSVKLHTDSVAAKSAQSINALAYTSGNNIVFNTNQYSPESDSGKKLIAHELTHVVQQGLTNQSIQRQLDPLDGGLPPGGLPQQPQAQPTDGGQQGAVKEGSSSSSSSGSSGGGGGGGPVASGDCRVDVRATKIPALHGIPIYHLFVILHNKGTGEESYYRGGPAGSGPFGNIVTMHGRYLPGTIDWEPSAPSVTAQDPVDCTTTDACLVRELARIDGTATPYAPTGPNSNTVARTILHNCGIPEVKPVWVAPGWGDPVL